MRGKFYESFEDAEMIVRYCIRQTADRNWTVVDHQAGPLGNESLTISPDFMALLDAIHFMFSHGYGEFCIQKI